VFYLILHVEPAAKPRGSSGVQTPTCHILILQSATNNKPTFRKFSGVMPQAQFWIGATAPLPDFTQPPTLKSAFASSGYVEKNRNLKKQWKNARSSCTDNVQSRTCDQYWPCFESHPTNAPMLFDQTSWSYSRTRLIGSGRSTLTGLS